MVTPFPRPLPAPSPSPWQGVQDWLSPRSNMLLGVGAGLLSGDLGKVPLYAQQGIEADDAYSTAQKQEAERQQALQDQQALRAKYSDFFRQQGENELADLVASDQGPAPGDLYWKWREMKGQGGKIDESFFGTGVPVQMPDGSVSYGQFGSRGSFNIPQLPDGAQFLTPVQQLNAGTRFTGVDKFGNPAGAVTPIDNQGAEMDRAVGKGFGEQIMDVRSAAADAQASLSATREARKLLDSGVITGFGADFKVGLGKALQQLGFNVAPDAIANSEAFVATRAQEVGRLIKLFGAGTGLSDADREFATRAAAGSIEMNEAAIRKILEINERAAQNVITRYNEMVAPIEGRGSLPALTMGDAPTPAGGAGDPLGLRF